MKPVILAFGLFVALLLVRNTFTMSAQGTSDRPRTARAAATDTRLRRVAVLEAQEQALMLRQQQIEAEHEQAVELLRKLQNQVERLDADSPEDQAILGELALSASRFNIRKRKTSWSWIRYIWNAGAFRTNGPRLPACGRSGSKTRPPPRPGTFPPVRRLLLCKRTRFPGSLKSGCR